MAPNLNGGTDGRGPKESNKENGPMAICFDDEMGYVAEKLGPKSGHWKRLARMAHVASLTKEKDQIMRKRTSSIQLQELEPNVVNQK